MVTGCENNAHLLACWAPRAVTCSHKIRRSYVNTGWCTLPKVRISNSIGCVVTNHGVFATREPRQRGSRRVKSSQNGDPAPGDTRKESDRSNGSNKAMADKEYVVEESLSCYGTGSEVVCVMQDGDVEGKLEAQNKAVNEKSTGQQLVDAALLVSPFFFWGTSMVAMKELEPHTTPMLVAAWRLLPAGVVLLGWAQLKGNKGPSTPIGWLAVILFGIIDGTCFQGFLAQGLQRTSAGLGSVIIDSQPLTVAVIASLLFGETLGPIGIGGLILGITGLVLLEVSPESLSFLLSSVGSSYTSIGSSMSSSTVSSGSIWDSGEWWMLLAAQSMAIGTVMVRWVSKYSDPIAATGWHMIFGSIPLLFLAAGQDQGGSFTDIVSSLNVNDYLLLLYVSLLGSAASYGVFFYEATVRGNITALSSLTFLTPMFAAAGGYVMLGEVLTPLQLTGALITVVGVTCINWKGTGNQE
eukprot:jgi/Picsp_1/5202/NSC_02565-R1_uncharacterized transporter sll0355-like